jgi:hypothetical protein
LASLLKQQLLIIVDRLQAKKNKRPFSVFVCSKQMEVCHIRFPVAENKLKLPFSVPFSVVAFRKSGDMGTWSHGDMESWRWRHGDGDMEA